jgi:hypothetical protein
VLEETKLRQEDNKEMRCKRHEENRLLMMYRRWMGKQEPFGLLGDHSYILAAVVHGLLVLTVL